LLETIYASFDAIARRRRVFKVETIGDCYVAVCGLPVARQDHAVVMARFANECRLKMNDLVVQLKEILGKDTADLAMRTGLHSGSVTGKEFYPTLTSRWSSLSRAVFWSNTFPFFSCCILKQEVCYAVTRAGSNSLAMQ